MTAQISAYGRLVADPQLKTTSKGTQMAMASMAVPLPCNQADDGTATMWLHPSTVIDMSFSRSPFTAENGNNVPQERAVIDSDALNCVG